MEMRSEGVCNLPLDISLGRGNGMGREGRERRKKYIVV